MLVIVGGCGRLGAEIATRLSGEREDVVIVDINELAFDRLGSAFNGETVVGDITDRDVLERASVRDADGLLAATRFDNANLMAVEIATHLYGVERCVARLFNPEREASYRKLGIRYVSATSMLAKQFLNQLRVGTFRQHVTFEVGDVEVVEMVIDAAGHELTVGALEVRRKLRVAAIQRGERVIIPAPDDQLQHGDLVVAAARRGAYGEVAHLVEPTRGRPHGDASPQADRPRAGPTTTRRQGWLRRAGDARTRSR